MLSLLFPYAMYAYHNVHKNYKKYYKNLGLWGCNTAKCVLALDTEKVKNH